MNLKNIISQWDDNGFTTSIKWNTARYVVALTHNKAGVSINKLNQQIRSYSMLENINVWGWTDNTTNIKYIDVSTSFNSLKKAREIWKMFKQIAIFDLKELKEIIL